MNKFEQSQFAEILNYLIEDTKDRTRQWIRSSHTFNSDTSYYMESFSDDNKTKFQCCVRLNPETFLYEKHGCMTIHNTDFKRGFEVFGLNDNRNILILEKLVYEYFVSNLVSLEKPSNTLGSILGTMGKQYTRNRKLEELLDGLEEETVKVKGFFERLFK